MRGGRFLVVFVIFILLFSSVNAVKLKKVKNEYNKDSYRVINVDKAIAKQKDCIGSVDFLFPEEIIVDTGIYPVLIEWNIDVILSVTTKSIYDNNITNIAKISNLRTSTVSISHNQKGPYEWKIYCLDPVSIFFKSDAGKTKNVEIIIKISNSLENTEQVFTKNIEVKLGEAKIKIKKLPLFENLNLIKNFLGILLIGHTKN